MNYLSIPFGDKEPREVAPLDVDRLRLSLSKKKALGTVKNVLELLRRLSNFAEKKRLCAPLPFRVSMPRVNNLKTEDLNAKQMARLLTVLRAWTMTRQTRIPQLILMRGTLFIWRSIPGCGEGKSSG